MENDNGIKFQKLYGRANKRGALTLDLLDFTKIPRRREPGTAAKPGVVARFLVEPEARCARPAS